MGKLSETTARVNHGKQQTHEQHTNKTTRPQSSSILQDENSSMISTMADQGNPRYMTPTFASRSQAITSAYDGTPHSRPETPLSNRLTSGKHKGWIVSAGRRLGINTPRSRKEGREKERSLSPKFITRNSSISPQGTQLTDSRPEPGVQTKAKTRNPMSSHPPTTVPRSQDMISPTGISSSKGSAPEKPLPSLPVATVQPSSPVARRSLIDASEKPLRRSLSPSGGAEVQEDWPVIFPSRPTSPNSLQKLEHPQNTQSAELKKVKPAYSLDPSEDSSNLIRKKGNVKTLSSQGKFSPVDGDARTGSGIYEVESSNGYFTARSENDSTNDFNNVRKIDAAASPGQSLDSTLGILPNAPAGAASTTNLIQSHTFPHHLQTRGVMSPSSRVRYSVNRVEGVEIKQNGARPDPPKHAISPRDGLAKPKVADIRKKIFIPGPIRNPSNGRNTITINPSIYHKAAPASVKIVSYGPSSYGNTRSKSVSTQKKHEPPASGPPAPPTSADFFAVKQSKVKDTEDRRSSIPLLSRRIKITRGEESEGEVLITKAKKGTRNSRVVEEGPSGEGDIDTDFEQTRRDKIATQFPNLGQEKPDLGLPKSHQHHIPERKESAAAVKNPSLDTHAVSSLHDPHKSQPGTIEGSPTAENQSEVGSLRLVDGRQGYRVKRLSLVAPEHGPTLKILDTAEEIIMGSQSRKENDNFARYSNKRHSVPRLLHSVVTKEQLRKTTETLLKRSGGLPIRRILTTRSLNKGSRDEEAMVHGDDCALDMEWAKLRKIASNPEIKFGSCQLGIEDPFAEKMNEAGAMGVGNKNLSRKAPERPLRDNDDSWLFPLSNEHDDSKSSAKRTNMPNLRKGHQIPAPSDENLSVSRKRNSGITTTGTSMNGELKPKPEFDFANPFLQAPQGVSSTAQQKSLGLPEQLKTGINGYVARDKVCREIPNRFSSISSTPSPPYHGIAAAASLSPHDLETVVENGEANSQISASKGMFSSLRELFHKKSTGSPNTSPAAKRSKSLREKNQIRNYSGSPFSSISTPLPQARIIIPKRGGEPNAKPGLRRSQHGQIFRETPVSDNPGPDETHRATNLAVDVLERARVATDPKRRTLLLELGKMMVDGTTASRDAEKAMEEAKQAAARAEIYCMMTKKALMEITQLVGGAMG